MRRARTRLEHLLGQQLQGFRLGSADQHRVDLAAFAGVLPGAEAVHDVKCGCAIAEVKKCGEFVSVDGKFVPLTNHGLPGKMPFCGKKGLKAKVAGELKDGKLVATKVEVLQ